MRQRSVSVTSAAKPRDAFLEKTYVLLDDYEQDFGLDPEQAGESGVLLASDFLLETLGHEASWERFDARTFGAFLRERVPPFAELLPAILAALAGFFCFLCKRGIVTERRASTVVAATYLLVPARKRAA